MAVKCISETHIFYVKIREEHESNNNPMLKASNVYSLNRTGIVRPSTWSQIFFAVFSIAMLSRRDKRGKTKTARELAVQSFCGGQESGPVPDGFCVAEA
jgi:hypothetical protein